MHGNQKIKQASLDDYAEQMSRVVFQTGISWRVVESKWPEIRKALQGFKVKKLARLSKSDLNKLMNDSRVIRNRRKLEAIRHNAQRLIELDTKHDTFQSFLRSHRSFDELVDDLQKQFKFFGDTGCYHFLYVVGEKVPSYEKWCASRQ